MSISTEEITALYRSALKGPFPYNDIRWLHEQVGRKDWVVPDLDMYFSSVAGLASGTHWRRWPLWKIQHYLAYLRKDVYDHCPAFRKYRGIWNEKYTPSLNERIIITDRLRTALIPHLEACEKPRALAARLSRGRKK